MTCPSSREQNQLARSALIRRGIIETEKSAPAGLRQVYTSNFITKRCECQKVSLAAGKFKQLMHKGDGLALPSNNTNHDLPCHFCHFASRVFVILRPPFLSFCVRPKSSPSRKSLGKMALSGENCGDYLIYSYLLLRDMIVAYSSTRLHIAFSQIHSKTIDLS